MVRVGGSIQLSALVTCCHSDVSWILVPPHTLFHRPGLQPPPRLGMTLETGAAYGVKKQDDKPKWGHTAQE